MFKKLLSNLPFNPSLIGQVSFYAKRMKQEAALRRLGVIFMALTMIVQFFAVVAPPQPSLAASGNDIIPGGISSQQNAVDWCNTNLEIKTIYSYFGVSCQAIASGHVVNLGSTDWNNQLYSLGRYPYQKQGEVPVQIGAQTFYMRYLWSWDTHGKSVYKAIQGTRSDGSPFYILFDCGNIVIIGAPEQPKPRCVLDGNLLASDPRCVACPYNGGILASNPACQSPRCPLDSSISASDSRCKACPYNSSILAGNPACQSPRCPLDSSISASDSRCKACPYNSSILAGSSSCKPPKCPYDSSIDATDSRCTVCPYDSSITKSNSRCERCPYTGLTDIPKVDSRCKQPKCQYDSSLNADDEKCVVCPYDSTITNSNAKCERCPYTGLTTIAKVDSRCKQPKCQYDASIFADDAKCVVCPYDSTIIISNPVCQRCPYEGLTGISIKDEGCTERCPYNTTLAKDSPSCKPCTKATNQTDSSSCIKLSKKASNATQKIANADGTTAHAGDTINYTLTAENDGKALVTGFAIQENVGDILEYADITDLHGGTWDKKTNIITWAKSDIAPGATITALLTVKIKTPIPNTPIATSNPGTGDMTLTNVYGNAINIKLPPTVVKTTEQLTTRTLPNTGPGTSLIMGFTLVAFIGYLFARSKLFATELDIVRFDFVGGGY